LWGTPPQRRVSIYALDLFYGISNRVTVDLTLPYLVGSGGVVQGNTAETAQFYEANASGFGDMAIQAEYWLNDPTKPSRVQASVDLGLKMPTGNNNVQGDGPNGPAPIDEAFQLGNGGWEMLFRAQAYGQITGPLYAYVSGYYGLSLTEHTDVQSGIVYNGVGIPYGVPDTYSGRLGVSYILGFAPLVVSLGGRINGVTVKDIVGGGDIFWRRPGYEVYIEPGLSWTLGTNTASVSVPVRAYQNKLDSLLDEAQGRHRGSDFAAFLVVASVSRRF
jgi:hypothetical protein